MMFLSSYEISCCGASLPLNISSESHSTIKQTTVAHHPYVLWHSKSITVQNFSIRIHTSIHAFIIMKLAGSKRQIYHISCHTFCCPWIIISLFSEGKKSNSIRRTQKYLRSERIFFFFRSGKNPIEISKWMYALQSFNHQVNDYRHLLD